MDTTKWLQSPVSQKSIGLKPVTAVTLEPYYGRSKSIKLFRTIYTVGSSDDCDIHLDDPYVSPKHAQIFIEKEGDSYRIRDLHSKNGVFLNGQRVIDAPLPDRGHLQLGRSKLRWKKEQEEGEQGEWVARSEKMKKLLNELKDVARSDLPILLLGETGTGKEYLARFVHEQSARNSEKFVSVNGALTDGPLAESELFGHTKGAFTGAESPRVGAIRAANHGTLFLDEVADIPLGAQVKLLRTLELGEVKPLGSDHVESSNFRIVSATSQNVQKKIQQGTFRIDLYFRIAGACVQIPPLREREEDILAISEQIFSKNGCEIGSDVKSLLLSYDWPGNVRELKAWAQKAVVRAKADGVRIIRSEFCDYLKLKQAATSEEFLGKSLDEMEREMILQSLNRNGWARRAAAEELKISRSTLYDKMKKYGIRYQ